MLRIGQRSLLAGVLICLATGISLADEKSDLEQQLAPHYGPPQEFVGKFGPYHNPLVDADGLQITTPEKWRVRRAELRAAWLKELGGDGPTLIEKPVVKRLETVEHDGFIEHRLAVQIFLEAVEPLAEAWLLVPKGAGPFPAVLVPFYEPMTSIGRGEKGHGTHDYGLQLVKRGIASLSIGTPDSKDLKGGSDTRQALVLLGKKRKEQPLLILADVAANCHTAMSQMPEIQPDRIGIIGLSYGGKWTMFASCLYDKFACAVWSDPGIVFNEKNTSVNYYEPWYLGYDPNVERKAGAPSESNPRTGLYKKMVDHRDDFVSLHSLIAPRPLLLSGGTEDPPDNWQALNYLVEVNKVLGYENRVAMTSRERHVPTPEALKLEIAFLEYWLKYGLKE